MIIDGEHGMAGEKLLILMRCDQLSSFLPVYDLDQSSATGEIDEARRTVGGSFCF
jgi:hypothetical protein